MKRGKESQGSQSGRQGAGGRAMLGLQLLLPTEGLDMVRDIVSDRSAEQTAVRRCVQSKG